MDKKISGFIVRVKENFYGPFATAQAAVDWLNTDGIFYGGAHTIEFLYEPTTAHSEYNRQQKAA